MNISADKLSRLQFLTRVVQKEIVHLNLTDQRLFVEPFSTNKAKMLETDVNLAERVDAFVARFGRLQDTVGDKLLPRYLDAVGEKTGASVDNLNRAEKLNLIESVEMWVTLRDMRNQMIHEYMEDIEKLVEALNKGHEFVKMLSEDATRIISDIEIRGWTQP